MVGKVRGRQHRLDPVKSQRSRRVDPLDARVRMRAPEHEPPKHAGDVHVGAKTRPARHLVDAVGTRRPRADHLELPGTPGGAILWHCVPPCLAYAGSGVTSVTLVKSSLREIVTRRREPCGIEPSAVLAAREGQIQW